MSSLAFNWQSLARQYPQYAGQIRNQAFQRGNASGTNLENVYYQVHGGAPVGGFSYVGGGGLPGNKSREFIVGRAAPAPAGLRDFIKPPQYSNNPEGHYLESVLKKPNRTWLDIMRAEARNLYTDYLRDYGAIEGKTIASGAPLTLARIQEQLNPAGQQAQQAINTAAVETAQDVSARRGQYTGDPTRALRAPQLRALDLARAAASVDARNKAMRGLLAGRDESRASLSELANSLRGQILPLFEQQARGVAAEQAAQAQRDAQKSGGFGLADAAAIIASLF